VKIIIFALIPLILSLGIIQAFPFSDAEKTKDSETECRAGMTLVFRIISNNHVCVSYGTADRWESYGIAEKVSPMEEESSEVMDEVIMETDIGIETIETKKGTITIDHDYLTPESAKLLSDELFFQRAVQVYHLALPAVGGAGIFYEQDKVGASVGDIIYWSDFMNSEIELLTGNTSVLYFMSLQDLSDGPIIVHMPAGNLQGHADNIYQQVITDWGIVGPNEGNEALFLFLPQIMMEKFLKFLMENLKIILFSNPTQCSF